MSWRTYWYDHTTTDKLVRSKRFRPLCFSQLKSNNYGCKHHAWHWGLKILSTKASGTRSLLRRTFSCLFTCIYHRSLATLSHNYYAMHMLPATPDFQITWFNLILFENHVWLVTFAFILFSFRIRYLYKALNFLLFLTFFLLI